MNTVTTTTIVVKSLIGENADIRYVAIAFLPEFVLRTHKNPKVCTALDLESTPDSGQHKNPKVCTALDLESTPDAGRNVAESTKMIQTMSDSLSFLLPTG